MFNFIEYANKNIDNFASSLSLGNLFLNVGKERIYNPHLNFSLHGMMLLYFILQHLMEICNSADHSNFASW